MCVVSAVGDHYGRLWPDRYPWVQPHTTPNTPPLYPARYPDGPSRQEFDDLKKAVEEALEVLKVAKKYDDDHGEPDCEVDEKVRIIKEFADAVGVDLSEVFGKPDKD